MRNMTELPFLHSLLLMAALQAILGDWKTETHFVVLAGEGRPFSQVVFGKVKDEAVGWNEAGKTTIPLLSVTRSAPSAA